MAFQENDINFIKSDGFWFETFVSDHSVLIPKGQSDLIIPVQFGIRVINKTPNQKRFLDFYLTPENLNSNSKLVRFLYDRNVTRLISESNFQLLMPGESVIFKLDGKLILQGDKILLSILSMDGGVWISFDSLELGSYQIRFHYKIEPPIGRRFLGRDSQGDPIYDIQFEFSDLWTGSVSTPYKTFSLT